jgi:hypothetical protein
MTRSSTDSPQWATVDEGWGRKAADFATLSEPSNCREYVAVHHRLGVNAGDLKSSPGALAPFRLAAAEKVDNQAMMVSLGRPGAGEQLLESYGFADVERLDVPFALEFADPEVYARAGFYRASL